MSNRPFTVADAILETLKRHKVTHLFGYPGGAILPFYDALPYHPELKHILVRNEQGAAFMAQGWARTKREIGVCVATSGPGATNLVTGIADAYLDSVPILALTGQVPLATIGKDMFQEVDMTGVTMSITKHNYLLEDPSKAVEIVTEAIHIATSGRPGPVHIDMPKDIQNAPHPRDFEIPVIDLKDTDPLMQAYNEPDDSVMERVMTALQKAKRPIMLLGQGVKHAQAEELAEKLIDTLGIPTTTTILGKGIVQHNHKDYLGILGMHGFYHANMAIHEADFILNIGSRFDDRIVGRYDIFGKKAHIIHVDIDASELNKVVKVEEPIHSDAKLFLQKMLKSNTEKLNIDPWRKKISNWREQRPYERTTENFSVRNCLAIIEDIVKKNPEQYIIVTDVGQHQMWAMLGCTVHSTTQWLSSGGSGCMGFGLPTSIGAAFANPKKTVICIAGDGGIQMNIQELGVLAHHKLNCKVFVMNNEYLGLVRQWQELFYDNNYSGVAMTNPDYPQLASAYGIPGTAVMTGEDAERVFAEAFSSHCPSLIECRVEKEDNVFPMVPGGKHLGETITEANPSLLI